ncbi:MAG: N-acetyltransferase [Chloroflexi bacterium]|nr:N-acetyltransferase [Chloroflexota bacterium]
MRMVKSFLPIVGTRVILRPYDGNFSEEDVERLYCWSLDREVLRLSGGTPTDLTLDAFRRELQRNMQWQDTNRLAVLIALNPEGDHGDGGGQSEGWQHSGIIGRMGVYGLDRRRRQAELGVLIGEKAYWGKEYGRQAICLFLKYVFAVLPLDRVYLYTYPDNLRAQHSFAACGFHPVTTHRRFSLELGTHNEIEMEIFHNQIKMEDV